MKTLLIAIIAALFSTSALAGQKYTDEQINEVIEARGLPPLGGSRVISDSNKKEHTSVIVSTTSISSKSTTTSK